MKRFLVIGLCLISLSLVACGNDNKVNKDVSKNTEISERRKEPLTRNETIVAKVGEEEITLAQVDAFSQSAIVYAKAVVGDDFENEINEVLENSSDEAKVSEYKNQKEIIIETRKYAVEALVQSKLFGLEARERKLIYNGMLEENKELIKMFYISPGSELSDEMVQDLFEKDINNMVNNYGVPREVAIKRFEDVVGENLLKDELKEKVSVSSEQIEVYYNENIEKFKIDGASIKSLEEVSEEIEKTLFYEKYSELIDTELERLSKKHKVETFEEELSF
ncbi:hypothetical protein QYB59_001540 [Clostridium perfringens]|nr:hypothetical protein [Clostridium perfringens]